jgi:four helix bundle protein
MKMRDFRDLQVWQRSMRLAEEVYAVTREFPREELFGLSGQLRRAAVSIPSNIAEGHGRDTDKAFALFLTHARGSLCELETQIELARNLHLLNPEQSDHLQANAAEIGKMLNGLLRTLRTTRPIR